MSTNNKIEVAVNVNVKKERKDIKEDTKEYEKHKTLWGLTAHQWGQISVFTNGFSVVFQMKQLLRTQRAQSFDMKFIGLMTLLNFLYFIMGILTLNKGLAIPTFSFVVYNLTVMYFYYYGKK